LMIHWRIWSSTLIDAILVSEIFTRIYANIIPWKRFIRLHILTTNSKK
jgi:hypothetical protein